MFRVKYDMTEGRLRRVTSRTAALVKKHSSSPGAQRRYGTAATNVTSPFIAGGGMHQRYSPVFERAEDPTLAEDFMPADPQTQHKIFRNLIMFDPIAGPATEYWRDLAFSNNILISGTDDPFIEQFYSEAIQASGIVSLMPMLLSDYLTFGKFVFHMIMDERLGYWTDSIIHDLDFVSIRAAPIPGLAPLIDIQPTQDHREWATSADPRAVDQRRNVDPVLVRMMAAGQPIPLAPENTMFLPRQVFGTDFYGTSYLTRIMPFKIYEKALLDASIAGARRRAGPLWHIKVWPDATDDEMAEVLDLFFAAEEDPIGGKVITREGVEVTPVGAAGEWAKLSDEWTFLSEAKMRALGISEQFLSGEANWNSMEMILSTFLEKVRAVRALFTREILLKKICLQLAQAHGFVKRTEAELKHGIRIGRKGHSTPEYILPALEWDKPLSPIADREYMDILNGLEEAGLPIPIRMKAQVAGFDIDKALASFEGDIETRKHIYEYKRAVTKLAESYGVDVQGNPVEGGGAAGGAGGLGEFGLEEIGAGSEVGAPTPDLGFGEETPLGGAEELGGEAAPAAPAAPEMPAAPEGAGASADDARFPIVVNPAKLVKARTQSAGNLVKELERIPIWDENGTLFGLQKRRIAKILDRIERTNPDLKQRQKLAENLPLELRRKEGLDRRASLVVQYLAIRLGYAPPVALSSEAFNFLRKYIIDRKNGDGLTRPITNEIVMLSRIAEAGGRKLRPDIPDHMMDSMRLIPGNERGLSDNLVLSGIAGKSFIKG